MIHLPRVGEADEVSNRIVVCMPSRRPVGELEELATYYDTHDTSEEMVYGE
jgi:hypothetical protein